MNNIFKHFEDDSYLDSSRFRIKNLVKGIQDYSKRISDFDLEPINKKEISYLTSELFKAIEILYHWSSVKYERLDDETKKALDIDYEQRNQRFWKESDRKTLDLFYKSKEAVEAEIINRGTEYVHQEIDCGW